MPRKLRRTESALNGQTECAGRAVLQISISPFLLLRAKIIGPALTARSGSRRSRSTKSKSGTTPCRKSCRCRQRRCTAIGSAGKETQDSSPGWLPAGLLRRPPRLSFAPRFSHWIAALLANSASGPTISISRKIVFRSDVRNLRSTHGNSSFRTRLRKLSAEALVASSRQTIPCSSAYSRRAGFATSSSGRMSSMAGSLGDRFLHFIPANPSLPLPRSSRRKKSSTWSSA